MVDNKNKVTLTLTKEKETKGTWRYQEVELDDAANAMNYAYIQKSAVKSLGSPEKIRITIEAL